MASAIVNPLLAAEPFEEAIDGPRSPTSEVELQLYYEEQERQETQRRLSRRNSRTKSWRRSFVRTGSSKNVNTPPANYRTPSEADSDAYGTGYEESSNPRSPSPSAYGEPSQLRSPPTHSAPIPSSSTTPIPSSWGPTPGVGAYANASRKPLPGRPPASNVTSPAGSHMTLPIPAPAHYVRDQSHIPWHQRKYEIYQPPAIGARAPPRYVNYHLLSEHARERLKRAAAQGLPPGRAPLSSLVSTGSMFSGVGSGVGMGSVRSSLSMRSRPSLLGAMSPANGSGGSAGIAGLETITASPASTAAALNSPSLDPTSALNAGPAASHRLSTLLKRPPASPHTFSQPLPTDATDLMDGTDPFGSMWHHASPYDVGETVFNRGFGRGKDSGSPDQTTPRPSMFNPLQPPSAGPKKGPSPLSQSASAINLADPEPPLPEPPGSPDLLSGTRVKRKLSKRRSTDKADKGNSNGGRGGLSSLFSRKPSVDEGAGGLRNRSRPPLSPSSLSLAQSQSPGVMFPTGSTEALGAPREKRARRRLSKRGRNRTGSTSSAASIDSGMDRQSLETPIHAQFAQLPEVYMGGAGAREVEIVELPSAKDEPPISAHQTRQQTRPPSQQPTRPASQQQQQQQYQTRPPSQQQQAQASPQSYTRPSSQQQHNTLPDPPASAPPAMLSSPTAPAHAYAPPPVSSTKPTRERKISAASISSFLSRVTSRDKDKDREEKHPPRAASAQETDRKVAPHMLLNHVGPGGKRNKGERGSMFGRFARKLSLIRRRSVDVVGRDGEDFGGDNKLDAALKPLGGRPSFQVERRPRETSGTVGRSSGAAQGLQRRATLDLAPQSQRFPRVSPEPSQQSQPQAQAPAGYGQAQLYSGSGGHGADGTDEIFAPIDPKLRSSRLINQPFSPPPRIPDLAIATNRDSWNSLHKHVANARPPKSEVGAPEERPPHPSQSTPTLALAIRSGRDDDELAPPPPIGDGNRHPDSPHSIPKWGITNGAAPRGPGLIMNGSPTDDSPLSLPRTMLTVANPDMVDSEGEDPRMRVRDSKLEAGGVGEERRNRALPPNPPMSPPPKPFAEPVGMGKRESVKPLVVKKERSRTPSPEKPSQSGRESPMKPGGRESPTKRTARDREKGREQRREHSPVKPVRRTEPLKDHSAVNSVVFSPQKPKTPLEALKNAEAVDQSLRSSMMAAGSTTSVDAIHGDDDAEFGAKRSNGANKDSKGHALRHSRASMDSIGKMHVITPKTSLQKIRVRVVSNTLPIEITKESSPVKESAPELHPSADATDSTAPAPPTTVDSRPTSVTEPSRGPSRSKSRPRSGYTGADSRHSIYGTATSVSTDDYGEVVNSPRSSVVGPRQRMPVTESERPLSPPVASGYSSSRASPDMRTPINSKHVESSPATAYMSPTTPYMTPTDEHGPLHPFSDKPVEYRNLLPSLGAPINVMRVETSIPPFQKGDNWSKAQDSPDLFKSALAESSYDMAPPKAPFMNEAFSISKEKLAAHAEFKKASGQRRDSVTESERDRRRARDEREAELRKERDAEARKERARAEREQELARQRDRADRDRLERERLEREQQERDRAERERVERERAERAERAERDRAERHRQEKARARAEQERLERERIEKERAEQERVERERLERERERAEKERLERERQERSRAAQRQKELEREQERERERTKDRERQARERDRERVEKERLERERQELERERMERERAERMRADWEHLERERIADEEMRQREREQALAQAQAQSQPPPLMHSHRSNSGGARRPRHGVDGDREVHVVTMKDMRKSSRHGRTPTHSRSVSPTSTAPPPPPPPKDDRPYKSRQRSRTDVTFPSIASASTPTNQTSIEILGGVPVLPQGTHIEVAEAFPHRPSSENASDVSTLKAREAWERERLDKGQSVLGPGGQRAVIPDPSPPRPAPDPRQRRSASKGRSQTAPSLLDHAEPYTLPSLPAHPNASVNVLVPEYSPTHTAYVQVSYPPVAPSRSHNPLPKPPTIGGPYPLHHHPGQTYSNPNRHQRNGSQPRPPSASRNPLPVPPRVSSYPIHHNVSPPRGMPPGAVDSRAPGRWETMPS
ncbi:hypothetical protein BDV93DRAFT_525847 [Ceratobasidium sp. AG-I]|nr:hypothetical protein BDV93DRAFT_525847 [Ceratobasidium sp. AG-I]